MNAKRTLLITACTLALLAAAWLFRGGPPGNTLQDAVYATQEGVRASSGGRAFSAGKIDHQMISGDCAYVTTQGDGTIGKGFFRVTSLGGSGVWTEMKCNLNDLDGSGTEDERPQTLGGKKGRAWIAVDFTLYQPAAGTLKQVFRITTSKTSGSGLLPIKQAVQDEGERHWKEFLASNRLQSSGGGAEP